MNDNSENYKWGFLFYDPEDPRVIVPKRLKYFGWSLNFANPWTYVIIFGYILLMVFMRFL
jgi:uncharacterized membrane protein